VFESSTEATSRGIVVPNNNASGHRVIETSQLDSARVEVRSVSVSDNVLGALVQSKIRQIAEDADLTAREVEVFDLLYVGRATRDIAMVLDISERTVKYHQANVLRKVGADNRVDLIRLLL